MINNFELIKPLLKFESENDFYFLQIIQRKKDHKQGNILGTSNNSRLIKAYYIYSIEQLEKYKNEIIQLCELFGARAGIGLNKRNSKDLSLEMLALLATNIKSNHFNQLGNLYNTICGQHFVTKDKVWLLDIDTKDEIYINKIKDFVDNIKQPEGVKIITIIPSKQGCHLVTKPFNPNDFYKTFPDIEIHKNNPTNLYVP